MRRAARVSNPTVFKKVRYVPSASIVLLVKITRACIIFAMQSPIQRLIRFIRTVIPEDPSCLMFLCGCFFLFISFQLRWWPDGVSSYAVRHAGPSPVDTSGDPTIQAVNRWIPIYWWCSLVFYVCGIAGFFTSLWPGRRPARFVFVFIWLPCLLALAEICVRFLYLVWQPFSYLLDNATSAKQHNLSWAISVLWQLGPGFHSSLAGFILISVFLSRMTFGLSILPMSLESGSALVFEEREQWSRLWLFVLFAAVGLYVVRFFANLPFLGIWTVLAHAGFVDANGNISGKAAWIFYLFGPLTSVLVAAVAAWAIGKDRWKYAREFLSAPAGKYLALAVIFSTVIGQFVPTIEYLRARIHWAVFEIGRFFEPSWDSYFTIPRSSAFAEYLPAAFFEEVVWRGYLQPRFVARFGIYRGIFLLSVAWGVAHLQTDFGVASTDGWIIAQISSRLATCVALGFVLSWLTLRSGSIWPAVIAHGLDNVFLATVLASNPHIQHVFHISLWGALAWLLYRYWPPQAPYQLSFEPLELVPESSV
jgi:membrane protease YdiL (CAAX protease family)